MERGGDQTSHKRFARVLSHSLVTNVKSDYYYQLKSEIKKKGDQAVCYIFPTSDKVGHDNNRLGRNGIQNMILGERGKYARRKKWKRVF